MEISKLRSRAEAEALAEATQPVYVVPDTNLAFTFQDTAEQYVPEGFFHSYVLTPELNERLHLMAFTDGQFSLTKQKMSDEI